MLLQPAARVVVKVQNEQRGLLELRAVLRLQSVPGGIVRAMDFSFVRSSRSYLSCALVPRLLPVDYARTTMP